MQPCAGRDLSGAKRALATGLLRLLGRASGARKPGKPGLASLVCRRRCGRLVAIGAVRLATSHERVHSQLRKRGEPPRVVGSAADSKAKGPIERRQLAWLALATICPLYSRYSPHVLCRLCMRCCALLATRGCGRCCAGMRPRRCATDYSPQSRRAPKRSSAEKSRTRRSKVQQVGRGQRTQRHGQTHSALPQPCLGRTAWPKPGWARCPRAGHPRPRGAPSSR